jgi:membrane-bound metal-dependent hydrolase YbcI (DUF457 family)
MDLPTHAIFGFSIGLIFFGRPDIALLIGLGTLLPDLDREYWFIPIKAYLDEQYHRALFHNVFVVALAYLISPFLALGMFLHMLLDSFTTSKDRGCEWFFPLSRLVKRGMYDANFYPQPLDPNERIYFYQEDLHATIEYPEPDLPEPESPWRRVYGPALNSSLLDRGFLCGAIAIILVWLLAADFSNLTLFSSHFEECIPQIIGYFSVGALFLGGELDRRDQEAPFGKTQLGFFKGLTFLKIPFMVAGGFLCIIWFAMYRSEISTNLKAIGSNWMSILLGALLIIMTSFAVVKWHTRKGKPPAIV